MWTALEKVGLACLAYIAYRIAKGLAALAYAAAAPSLNAPERLKSYGKWAVVTGGTDGIGKAFVEHLAKIGMDVIIISRSKAKLDCVADEIGKKYSVNVKLVEADFSEGSKVFTHIEKELFGLEIGVLVNNVGISSSYPEYFLDTPNKEKLYSDIIQLNIVTMLAMCQIVMPGMVEQRKGVVINISSTAAQIPSPLISVYAASKAFVSKFTKDLATEYKKYGLIIQCLEPGFVASKMSKIKKPTWNAPSPSAYVSSAITSIGIYSRTTGYWAHSILLSFICSMERIFPSFTKWMVMRIMENLKSRAIRKNLEAVGSSH